MAKILVVANCPSINCHTLQKAVVDGCYSDSKNTLSVISKLPFDSDVDDILSSDAIIIGTTENFGYMSGAIKDLFERIYYPCLEKTQGKPIALYIKAGLDGEGAKKSVLQILKGLRWKIVQPPLILKGEFKYDFTKQCFDLGKTMALGIESGIY